jgi:hypothetical protein
MRSSWSRRPGKPRTRRRVPAQKTNRCGGAHWDGRGLANAARYVGRLGAHQFDW